MLARGDLLGGVCRAVMLHREGHLLLMQVCFQTFLTRHTAPPWLIPDAPDSDRRIPATTGAAHVRQRRRRKPSRSVHEQLAPRTQIARSAREPNGSLPWRHHDHSTLLPDGALLFLSRDVNNPQLG